MSKLKPCPFCGGKADIYHRQYDTPFSEIYGYSQIGCIKCGVFFSSRHYEMQTPGSDVELEKDTQGCIEAWNGRANDDIERAIRILIEQYERAQKLEFVHKPLSWALYHTWQEVDRKEKERK